jgi:hypothetical protein
MHMKLGRRDGKPPICPGNTICLRTLWHIAKPCPCTSWRLLPGYCEVDWNAVFVHAYEAGETRRRQQEQRQSYWQDHNQGPFGGQDPQEFFQQVGAEADVGGWSVSSRLPSFFWFDSVNSDHPFGLLSHFRAVSDWLA